MRILLAIVLAIFVFTAALAQSRDGSVDNNPVQVTPTAIASAVNREAEGFADKAKEAMYKGDNETAVKMYDQAIRLDPKNAKYRYAKAMSLMNLDRKAGAIIELNIVTDLDPKMADAYGHLGALHYQMNDFDQCVKDLTKGIEVDPKSAFNYYQRGQCNYQLVDNQNQAQEDFKKAVELDPSYADRLKKQ